MDTLHATLDVFAGRSAPEANAGKMQRAAGEGFILATDLADYLVGKGESFRTAHGIIARLVAYGVQNGRSIQEMTLQEFKTFSPLFEEDVKYITVKSSLNARNNPGGTAPGRVENALVEARRVLGM